MALPVDKLIAYEADELTDQEVIELFSELVKSGLAWQLQGSYGRMALALINGGYLAEDGTQLATIESATTEDDEGGDPE